LRERRQQRMSQAELAEKFTQVSHLLQSWTWWCFSFYRVTNTGNVSYRCNSSRNWADNW
jgi:hypothetical protein